MPEQLIAGAGLWFVAACTAEFAAVFVEQAGAARSPEEDGERKSTMTLLLMLISLLTPGLLLLHAFFLTSAVEQLVRIETMALPISALLFGSILGAIFGALARGSAPIMRTLALPLALIALALTLYATSPSLIALATGLEAGGVVLPVRPV